VSAPACLATVPTLRLRLPAASSSASLLRAHVQAWLSELDVAGDEILELLLACSEALTIVVEQAARPLALVVDVDGVLQDQTVTVRFREYGLCRDTSPDPAARGYAPLGVALIEAMTDTFSIRGHPDGTTITLARHVRASSHQHRVSPGQTALTLALSASPRSISSGPVTRERLEALRL
jgi:anti-sigma regulatory factor (Ser/Thr protein kinase)